MATTSASSLGGYDYEFVNTPSDELMCLICTLVAKDPQQIQCCGKICCKECLTGHLKCSKLCPQCRRGLKTFPDIRGNRHIQGLKMKCQNAKSGCGWVNELRNYEDHLATCDYTLVTCPNECMDGEMELTLLRKDLNNHLITKCRKRKHQCLHCEEEGEYEERTTSHLDECPKVKVHCPNKDCSYFMPRSEIEQHRETCTYEMVECKYAMLGCDAKLSRKELDGHEKNTQCHLQVAVETVLDLKKKQERESTTFKFKITDFAQLKESSEESYSPSFYSHPGGYKMCATINANGDGECRGTHVSVFINLMKGDNDDNLSWPFTGTVTVSLLNQLEDKNHHVQSITFLDEMSNARVNHDGWGIGYGFPSFIPHADLRLNTTKNCQYLKNDTLYFQVSVEAPDNPKPWLTC